MTATDRPVRPDPTDTDREAVARVLLPAWTEPGWTPESMADAILSTTDPAAVAALARSLTTPERVQAVLDALVEAGVLRYVATNGDGSKVWLTEPVTPPQDGEQP